MLTKVISGGQTGTDIAAVKTAKAFGINTGGTLPKGYRTQDGPKPEYATLYGMEEHYLDAYPPRTAKNVLDSDGTLIIAINFISPGEKCTMRAIKKYEKPHLQIDASKNHDLADAVKWLTDNKISVLNIAGNSERTVFGMEFMATAYLTLLFEELGFKQISAIH